MQRVRGINNMGEMNTFGGVQRSHCLRRPSEHAHCIMGWIMGGGPML